MAVHELTDQFRQAQHRINLTERRKVAQAAHLEVRAVLRDDSPLRDHGLADRLVGSYARGVAIWPGKDVDVFGLLDDEDVDTLTPTDAYGMFAAALKPFGDRVTPQPRSFKISFGPDVALPDERFLREVGASDSLVEQARSARGPSVFDFSVDVVPAVHWDEHFAIPDGDPERWSESDVSRRWRMTNPMRLNDLTTTANGRLLVASTGGYVPTVKAIKQMKSFRLPDSKPSSLYYEFILHEGVTSGEVTGDSWADLTASAARYVADRLGSATSDPVCDPALGQPYEPLPSTQETRDAQDGFRRCADDAASAASASSRCEAARPWRRVLGANGFEGHDSVFPLPPGCRDDGTEIGAAVSANPLTGGSRARGFGDN